MKVSSPHMARILSRRRTHPGDRFKGMSEQGTASHDPDFPDKLREFMRTGWSESPLDVSPTPEAPRYAKRRSAVQEAFPGETVVFPSGTQNVRAKDTTYPFRP